MMFSTGAEIVRTTASRVLRQWSRRYPHAAISRSRNHLADARRARGRLRATLPAGFSDTVVLSGIGLVRDVRYTGDRGIDLVGALLSIAGMGGVVLGILVWQEGGESVAALIATGVVALGSLAWWLVRRKQAQRPILLDRLPV